MKSIGEVSVVVLLRAIVGPSALRCNTFQGAGQDIQAVGRGIEKAGEGARSHKNGRQYHTITATAEADGSITPAGATSVRFGSDQTYKIVASKDHDVTDVLVDGRSMGPVSRYQFDDVQSDHTIDVLFDRQRSHVQQTALP